MPWNHSCWYPRPKSQKARVPPAIPEIRPSTVLFGEMRGASCRLPQARPPKYAVVSVMKVPISVSSTSAPPCGNWRSSTACASANPIQTIPSMVAAIPQDTSWRRCRTRASRNARSSESTSTSTNWRRVP